MIATFQQGLECCFVGLRFPGLLHVGTSGVLDEQTMTTCLSWCVLVGFSSHVVPMCSWQARNTVLGMWHTGDDLVPMGAWAVVVRAHAGLAKPTITDAPHIPW